MTQEEKIMVSASIDKIKTIIDDLILRTPTGELRNSLTDLNIIILTLESNIC